MRAVLPGYYDCTAAAALLLCERQELGRKLPQHELDAERPRSEEVTHRRPNCRRWPLVRILLRADLGFARAELMAWCDANGVHFLFGLAKTDRLIAEIKAELEGAAAQSRRTGKPARPSRTSGG